MLYIYVCVCLDFMYHKIFDVKFYVYMFYKNVEIKYKWRQGLVEYKFCVHAFENACPTTKILKGRCFNPSTLNRKFFFSIFCLFVSVFYFEFSSSCVVEIYTRGHTL